MYKSYLSNIVTEKSEDKAIASQRLDIRESVVNNMQVTTQKVWEYLDSKKRMIISPKET